MAESKNQSFAERPVAPLSVLGVSLHDAGVSEIHGYMATVIEQKKKALVLNVNIHCLCLAQQHLWLRDFLNQAQFVFCDGDGVRWGLRLLGQPVPPKVTYDRWIWQLAKWAEMKGYSFFFMGGKPGIAELAAERLKLKFPKLKILGTEQGYFDKTGPENQRRVDRIKQLRPDILILGFGMPLQEKWLMENAEKLNAHIFLTGGAVFDYVAGTFKRAHGWMIKMNLEWLFRMFYDPRRLSMRYATEIPYFFYKVFSERLKRKGVMGRQ